MDISTPALVVNLDRMEANIRNWQAAIGAHGVALRPHVKTHKIPAIAQMQLAAGAKGITVAKVAEAEVFALHGCNDIFIAYPVIGKDKWARCAALAQRVRLIVGVDSETGVVGLSKAALDAGVAIEVRVEIDTGLGRCGIPFDQVEDLCNLINDLPGIKLDGIFTFRSGSFPGAEGRSAEELGKEEGELMASHADSLRAKGLMIASVSCGSTPTAKSAAAVKGVTEVRPGTYVFADYMMAERGAVSYDDIALSIMCTVVSKRSPEQFTIDGGSKTFCGDIQYQRLNLRGYGRAVGMEAYVESMSEEHGVVKLIDGEAEIGDRIAFHPIHVCTTVNLSDEIIGVRNGKVEVVWPVLARGKRT